MVPGDSLSVLPEEPCHAHVSCSRRGSSRGRCFGGASSYGSVNGFIDSVDGLNSVCDDRNDWGSYGRAVSLSLEPPAPVGHWKPGMPPAPVGAGPGAGAAIWVGGATGFAPSAISEAVGLSTGGLEASGTLGALGAP